MKSSQKVIIEISLQIQKMTILLSLIASTLLKLLLVYPISSEDVPNRKVVAPSRTIEEILNKSINKIVLKLWKTYQKISKLWSWSLHFPFLKILMKLQKTMYCQNQSPFLIFNNKLWKQSSFSMTLLAPKSKFQPTTLLCLSKMPPIQIFAISIWCLSERKFKRPSLLILNLIHQITAITLIRLCIFRKSLVQP